MANVHIRFEDIDEYEPSDSETEYTEREKTLLKKVRTKPSKNSDSEEEVYGLEAGSSEDENNISESDIEDRGDDGMPDVRAWGQNKKAFYSTDYVDQDYGGYEGKDAAAADQEEEEARVIQERLAAQLDDEDFALDMFKGKPDEESRENVEEIIKTDLSTLSKRQLLQLFRKESPEFFELVEDFKVKMEELKNFISPVIELNKKGNIPQCEATDFVTTYYHLILNYFNNVNVYLLLKASRVSVQSHPVVKRLYQYRQLLAQLEPVYVEIIRPQLDILIEMNRTLEEEEDDEDEKDADDNEKQSTKIKLKKLNLVELLERKDRVFRKNKISTEESPGPPSKKLKTKSILKNDKSGEGKSVSFEPGQRGDASMGKGEKMLKNGNSGSEHDENVVEVGPVSGDMKRAITYQMSKNKGLTPHRKKEQRNPRVKHRNKFRKAKIRRKGAVREVRTELSRYGGEISGIKASVSKSVKIK